MREGESKGGIEVNIEGGRKQGRIEVSVVFSIKFSAIFSIYSIQIHPKNLDECILAG